MSRPQAVDTDVASGGGRPCDDLSAPVAHLEANRVYDLFAPVAYLEANRLYDLSAPVARLEANRVYDLSAPVAHLEANRLYHAYHAPDRGSTYAGGRRGKERIASLRAELRLAAGGRRLPRPSCAIARNFIGWRRGVRSTRAGG